MSARSRAFPWFLDTPQRARSRRPATDGMMDPIEWRSLEAYNVETAAPSLWAAEYRRLVEAGERELTFAVLGHRL